MADRALLDMFGGLLDVSEGEDDGTLSVFPVVHDALSADREALSALCSRYGGIYVDANRGPGARGPLVNEMAALVREACEAESTKVEITEIEDRVHATAPEFAEDTGGIGTLLRVVEVLCSSEFAEHSFAVLGYDLDGLDPTRARLLWTLTTMTIADQAPSALRWFVPIAGGQVDVEHHCDRPLASMRFAIRDGEFIKRGPSKSLENALREILPSLDTPLVLFLGAGASAAAGISAGDSIRDEALAHLVGKPIGSADLPKQFRDWLEDRDRWMHGEKELSVSQFVAGLTLERVLREEFWILGGNPRSSSPIVKRLESECAESLERLPTGRTALAEVVEKIPKLVVATINFDRLIEDGHDEYVVLKSKDEFEQGRAAVISRVSHGEGPLTVLKVHGSIESPDTMVADVEATRRGLPKEVAETLDALLGDHALTWVWLGCSMRDVDLRQWLTQKSGRHEMREWFVDPLPGKNIREYVASDRRRDWAELDVSLDQRLVTETANNFLVGLRDRANELNDAT